MVEKLLRSGFTHVAFAFVAMGGWAYYVNSAHGTDAALRAGLVQGTASAILTALLKRALELVFQRLQASPWRRILPWVLSSICITSLLLLFHTLAGTPNILATIAVPLFVSTTYAIVYTLSLRTN